MITLNHKELDQFFKDKKVNGNILIAQDNTILFEKSFGMANFELSVPNNKDSVFRIGSVTKQFTAVLILKLIEERKLSLSNTLSKFILDYRNGDKITLKHLLNHSSGIYNFTNLPNFLAFSKTTITPLEIIDIFKSLPLDFPPVKNFLIQTLTILLLVTSLKLLRERLFKTILKTLYLFH